MVLIVSRPFRGQVPEGLEVMEWSYKSLNMAPSDLLSWSLPRHAVDGWGERYHLPGEVHFLRGEAILVTQGLRRPGRMSLLCGRKTGWPLELWGFSELTPCLAVALGGSRWLEKRSRRPGLGLPSTSPASQKCMDFPEVRRLFWRACAPEASSGACLRSG